MFLLGTFENACDKPQSSSYDHLLASSFFKCSNTLSISVSEIILNNHLITFPYVEVFMES